MARISRDLPRPLRPTAKKTRHARKEMVALQFDPDRHEAPIVTARAQGHLAQRMLERAEEHDVPIVSDVITLNALRIVDVGQPIPPSLYRSVAEILVFVEQMNAKKASSSGKGTENIKG